MDRIRQLFTVEGERGRRPGADITLELTHVNNDLHISTRNSDTYEDHEIALTIPEVHKLFEAIAEFLAVSK